MQVFYYTAVVFQLHESIIFLKKIMAQVFCFYCTFRAKTTVLLSPSLKPVIMVHTDMCFLYHCMKSFLCDTVDHRNRLDTMMLLHTTFCVMPVPTPLNLFSISSRIKLYRNCHVTVYVLVVVAQLI